MEELYLSGQEKFGEGDFEGAAADWTQVLDILEEGPQSRATRQGVVLNLISAYMQAHEAAGDTAEGKALCRGVAAMDAYVAELGRAYPDSADGKPSQAIRQGRIEMRDFIWAQTQTKADELCAEPEPEPEKEPIIIPDKPEIDPLPDVENQPTGHKLIIAGAVTLGVGVACTAKIIAGAVLAKRAEDDIDSAMSDAARNDARDRRDSMRNLAIAGGVISGVGLIAGSVMLGIGLARRARLGKGEVEGLLPQIGPHYAGLSWRKRF